MNGIYTAGGILLGVIILGIIIFLAIYYLRFNKKVLLIMETQGGRLRFAWDKGYRDFKKAEFKVMSHRNTLFQFPSTEDEYPMGRGSIIPYVVKNNQAACLQGISANPHFIPADINMFQMLVARYKKNYDLAKPKQNFWDKYGTQVMFIAMIVIFFLAVIFILQRVDKAIEMGQQWTATASATTTQVIAN